MVGGVVAFPLDFGFWIFDLDFGLDFGLTIYHFMKWRFNETDHTYKISNNSLTKGELKEAHLMRKRSN